MAVEFVVAKGREIKEFSKPFTRKPFNIDTIYYFGEVLLLPEYRVRGVGSRLMRLGHKFAKETLNSLEYTTAFTVVRDRNHPLRPGNYMDIDHFLEGFGYECHPELKAAFEWKDIDKPISDKKDLNIWLRKWPQQDS